jgi:hypothetical protein
LDHGTDLNFRDHCEIPLIAAASYRRVEYLEESLKVPREEINQLYRDAYEIVRILLSYGDNPNVRNIWGATPLKLALIKGRQNLAEFFRSYGSIN